MAFVVNPYCVAAMPEEIRKGFLKKVLGIVSSQLLYLMLIILLFRYVWVDDVKTTVRAGTRHITPVIHPLYTLYCRIYTYVHPLYMYMHHTYIIYTPLNTFKYPIYTLYTP